MRIHAPTPFRLLPPAVPALRMRFRPGGAGAAGHARHTCGARHRPAGAHAQRGGKRAQCPVGRGRVERWRALLHGAVCRAQRTPCQRDQGAPVRHHGQCPRGARSLLPRAKRDERRRARPRLRHQSADLRLHGVDAHDVAAHQSRGAAATRCRLHHGDCAHRHRYRHRFQGCRERSRGGGGAQRRAHPLRPRRLPVHRHR